MRSEIAVKGAALGEHGPKADIATMESVLAGLEQDIADAETERDRCQQAFGRAGTHEATVKARLDELLSGIPETLRDSKSIDAAIATKGEVLAVRKKAQDAATDAREAALSAQKEFEAAEQALLEWRRCFYSSKT